MKNDNVVSKDAFTKAASPKSENPETIKHVSDPLSFTISGTQGGKAKLVIEDQEGTIEAEFVPESPEKPQPNMSTDDITLDWQEEGYRILIKQEEEPSPNGIDGGRITRLVMVDENENTVNFDNGEWIEEPELPIECVLVDQVKDELNATPEPDEDIEQSPEHDPEHDI